MNIHEYQAKAVLKEFGVPVSRGVPDSRRRKRRRPPRARRPGLGRQSADPCGRPRQGRSACKRACKSARRTSTRRSRADMLGHTLVTRADRPAGQGGQPPLYRRRLGHREGILSLAARRPRHLAASPSSSRPKAAWTSRRSRIRRRRRSSPSRSIRRPASCPITAAASRRRWGLTGDLAKQAEALVTKLYTRLRRQGHGDARDQSADRSTKDGKLICLDAKVGFDDNALYRHPDIVALRDVTEEDAKEIEAVEIRPHLCRARRHDRLHGQRRRPRHGDDGHHQALWRRAGQLSRCRRRRHQGEGHGGLQDHHRRPARERHSGQHLRRHHEMRRHRRRRDRRGEGGRPRGAAGRAARRHQCRARQGDHRDIRPQRDRRRRPRRRRAEDRHSAVQGGRASCRS